MNRRIKYVMILLAAVLLLTGCGMRTVDQMYAVPKRSAEYQDLQRAIDQAMSGLEYCAPLSGENQQTVQMADLDGDGQEEYLLFASGSSEKPLQILVFGRTEEGYTLRETIESSGSGFELVEYVDIDGQPGQELVVGRQVSDQVLRSLSVYSFAGGNAAQLMTANYSKFVTCDLDTNGLTELVVIAPGATETDHAYGALYSFREGQMARSTEVNLSETDANIKRIMVGNLQDGVPAVYVASSVNESAIITDIFALRDGKFTNVSLSNESGTSIQTLRNYYIYADDIDNDGILELPSMMADENSTDDTGRYLVRWYAMDLSGAETDKMFTFHNLEGGWYLQLDEDLARSLHVTREGHRYVFSLLDEAGAESETIMTVYVLTGSKREDAATEEGKFIIFRGDEVIYAAFLEGAALDLGMDQESVVNSFHLIYKDWKTGETE